MEKLGIIGQGYVGTAIKEGMKNHYQIETYDKFIAEKSTQPDLSSLVNSSDILFCCLPTPMNSNGSCYLGIIEDVLAEINELSESFPSIKTIVIKSTVLPGTTTRFNNQFTNIDIIFSPEFLTEATFIDDFKNQQFVIFGGSENGTTLLEEIFRPVFPTTEIRKTSSTQAELVKYTVNCFLASKVSFANDIFRICDNLDVNYDELIDNAKLDTRLGQSHWNVPGHDGKFGFGGSCFPKDMNALSHFAKNELNIITNVIDGALKTNLEVRPEKDWEQLKGRAVVDNE
ncbi:MAG: hypothetical protein KAR35_04765 [Candidatus Heimdallarchaeota archaeon]|nr:hypothetical protein [Candidatus Heimdallarchaeota archaeon]MCK5048667.1 hypothetical protein [Candidatus Heimdallarchaeota archaeon]